MSEFLEKVGQLVDKAENYLALPENPYLPVEMRIDSLRCGLQELRDGLKEVYFSLGGEDVWGDGGGDARA